MYKKFIVFAILISFATPALAIKPENTGFSLPAGAVEVAPDVFNIGKAYDKKSDSFVDGYAIVHKKESAKTASAKGPNAPACYGFLATGAKWKTVENWTVFAGAGLDANFVLANSALNIAKWEVAGGNVNILGTGTLGVGTPSNTNIIDEKNEISFGDLDGGTIAVTIIWGTFGGPTANRKLVAWDQVFNTDYAWSATGEAGKMDFENISTHELGHAVGMADVYNSACSAVSMYGYGVEGETKKRDLAPADITGINVLY